MANRILVDANVIVAAVLPRDPHHKKAAEVLRNYSRNQTEFITNEYIHSETLTITLMRGKSMEAVYLLDTQFFVPETITVFPLPVLWQNDIMHVFISQKKYKGEYLSYPDASLIIQARKLRISTILTFDTTFEQFKGEFDLPCLSK
ncbi:MAG: type II toxin-antitoxin system VapC family toxin [Patescibacteria group bacterium]